MTPEYITVKRAAETLQLRYGQVIRLIKSGRLEATKVEGGWSWMVRRSSVEALKCTKQ